MRTGAAFSIAALLVVGCSTTDPCDGQAGICLSARVEGNVSGLDQLRLSLDRLPGVVLTPSTPAGFSLPVKVAILFPANAAGSGNLTIDGLMQGRAIASTGAVAVSLPATGKLSKTFTLTGAGPRDGGSNDLATGDGPAPPDLLPPPNISFNPSSLMFPSMPRGQISASMSVTFTNNTAGALSIMNVVATGDMTAFRVLSSSTCVPNQPVPGGQTCHADIAFQPVTSGKLSQSNLFTFSDGSTGTLVLSGVATPVWSLEVVPQSTGIFPDLNAVWGSGPTDVYAVGQGTPDNIFHSFGDGVWNLDDNPPNGAQGQNLSSVTGSDSQHLWAGSQSGVIWFSSGNGQWVPLTSSNPDAGAPLAPVTGLAAIAANDVWAATASPMPNTYHFDGTAWFPKFGTPTPLWAAAFIPGAAGLPAVVVVGEGGDVRQLTGNGFTPLTIFSNVPLRAVWGASPTTVFVGGDPSASPGSPTLGRCDLNANTCLPETLAGGALGGVTAISGRLDASSILDVYAVGFLGNQVLHTTGNGTWSSIQVAGSQGMRGVWVAANGDVYAVGTQGQINHYY